MTQISLRDLYQLIDALTIRDIDINIDSRRVKAGDIFFAIAGTRYGKDDLRKFIDQAVLQGAQLVFAEENYGITHSVPIIVSQNLREVLGLVAARLYPRVPQNLVAITGTNGKSSVVHYFQQIFTRQGINSASIGTMGIITTHEHLNDYFASSHCGHATTNDIATTRKVLDTLSKNHIEDVAMEVTSHGIDQRRVEGLKFNAALFTHLGYDHLDYHQSFEEYLQTKLKLFSDDYLYNDALVILNGDTLQFPQIYKQVSSYERRRILIITENRAIDNIDLSNQVIWQLISRTPAGQQVGFSYGEIKTTFKLSITGKFQIFNILAAALLALDRKMAWSKIAEQLPYVKSVKGRLQTITPPTEPWQVFIDYAHTPDSLQLVLEELKHFSSKGRLVVVFGCGGNRDQSKRQLMGQISSGIADIVIVTDDNPRREVAADIRRDIMSGISHKGIEIAGRADAIAYAVNLLVPGDVLLIAGKGHENYQTIGDEDIAFDDFLITERFLKDKKREFRN